MHDKRLDGCRNTGLHSKGALAICCLNASILSPGVNRSVSVKAVNYVGRCYLDAPWAWSLRAPLLLTALGLAVTRAASTQRCIEKGRRVSKCNPALAIRRAAVGFPVDTLIDGDDVAGTGPAASPQSPHQDAAAPIKRKQIGHPETLAGDHQ